ncbi:hypothetical protein KEM56_003332 [Ascosphaera pollenicola]|nr:hypothetical protein KEM56_003332 [Ascosphaera pollenicola]
MGERLRVRKNRVASGLDKVFKGLQKRALSAARAHNAQLQALLGQEKKKDSDQLKEGGVTEEGPSQEGDYAWLTESRRKGFGYNFVDEEQRADTADEDNAPTGVDEADATGNDSDKENAGPIFYTPIPPQERERPEAPSYSWPGRSGATEDSTGAEADVATTAGVSADGEAEYQDEKKPDKEKRWFSVGNGSFRKLVSGKMSDVIRASPSSIQRALSNTSPAASMLTTLSDQVQGDLPAPNHSVKSRSASIHTRKSNKSNISLPSLAEQTQAEPIYSPPPRICSPEETKFLASNGVYSFGEDLERQLSNINLSDSEAVLPKPDDATPRPRTPTKYTMDPTDTGALGGTSAGPRYRTPLGAGLNATTILRPNPNPGSRAPGGVRSRTGSGTNSSSHVDDRRDGAGANTSSLYPPALHPRSRRSSSPRPPPPYAVAVGGGGGADGRRDIAMNQGPDVRGSTAAFRERQVADGMTVKEQLLKLVDSTWPDEQ